MDKLFDIDKELRSASSSVNSQLPYSWDGECHLVVNNGFHANFPNTPEKKKIDIQDEVNFDLGLDIPDISHEPMEDYINCESGSMVSTDVTPARGTMAGILGAKTSSNKPSISLNAQLEFIMQTTKKPPKAAPPEKKCKRSRKTKKQLDIMKDALSELEQGQGMEKKQVVEIATKTGLSEVKVYKWFWDRGHKLQ